MHDGATTQKRPPRDARRTPRGPSDPNRPKRIAQAVLAVIERDGIAAVTHRSVAAEAKVPLGSTTYHFKALEDILVAAFERAILTTRAELEAWASGLGVNPDLAAELTELAARYVQDHQDRTIMEYELTFAALRRPVLHPMSRQWSAVLAEALERFVDPETADVLSTVFEGILIRTVVSGHPLDRGRTEKTFRRVAGI